MKKLIITLSAITIGFTAFAQTELGGTWTFEKQESISGNLYVNGSPKSVKITVSTGGLTFEKITPADGSDFTTTETVTFDGKPFQMTTSSKRKKVITLSKTGNQFTESAIYYNAADNTKVDHKTTDSWSIEKGKLVLDRKDENLGNGETWESKAYYSKN